MASCRVSEKSQTVYLRITARPGIFRLLATCHFSGL
jgi:hypothetical protein